MPGLEPKAPDTRLAPACRTWLLLGLLAGCPAGQEEPTRDLRLAPVTVQMPPGFQAHLARAVELAAQGRPEGAAGVLADLARRESTGLLPAGEGWHVPAHEAIEATLASLDQASRQAWLLLAGAEAEQELQKALAQRDEAGLDRLVRRYPGTAARDQALLALADLALERGQARVALRHLDRLQRASSQIEPARSLARSLLAWASLQEWGLVRRTLDRIDFGLTVAGRNVPAEELADFFAWAEPAPAPPPAVPGLEESAARLWLLPIEKPPTGSPPRSGSATVRFFDRGMQLLPLMAGPLAELDSRGPILCTTGDRLLVRHAPGLELLELSTGRLRAWLREAPGIPERNPRFARPSLTGSGLAERGLCRAGSLLLQLTDLRSPASPTRTQRSSQPPPAYGALAAWDLDREAWVWSTRFDSLPEPLNRATLHSGPAVAAGTVAVLLLGEGIYTLVGVSLEQGTLLWTRSLHAGGTTFTRPPALPLLGRGETFFVATGAGAVAALSARTGDLLWLLAYPRVEPGREAIPMDPPRANPLGTHSTPPRGFAPSALLLRGEILVLAPPDGDFLVGLHAASGRLAWLSARHDPGEEEQEGPVVDVLVGADQECLYLAGRRLMAVEISTGRRLWQTPLLGTNGRGVVAAQGVLLPTTRGVLLIEKSPPFRQKLLDLPGVPAGPLNLTLQGPFLLAAGLDRVGLWVAPAPWTSAGEGLEKARRLARCGDLAAALAELPPSPESEPFRVAWSVDLARQAQVAGQLDQTRTVLTSAVQETRSPLARLRLLEELFLLLERSGRTEEASRAFETFLQATLETARERGS